MKTTIPRVANTSFKTKTTEGSFGTTYYVSASPPSEAGWTVLGALRVSPVGLLGRFVGYADGIVYKAQDDSTTTGFKVTWLMMKDT